VCPVFAKNDYISRVKKEMSEKSFPVAQKMTHINFENKRFGSSVSRE